MNFNAPLLRPLRILLFPFSLIYGLIIWIRNKLFDKGWLSSASFNLPIIGVGNLSAGGTGKSPMVEFLVRALQDRFQVAVLSRGYKRKTKGYALATTGVTALDIGDEPMQFFRKFPGMAIAVGEERIVAIPQLLHDRPDTQVIVLDDAFQHRSVTPGLNILLTDCHNLFTRDWFLPTGDLRDLKSSRRRADLIIVTKCKSDLGTDEMDRIRKELTPEGKPEVFFTGIRYSSPYHILSNETRQIDDKTEILLVTGIANPQPLKKYLADHAAGYEELLFEDHHIFTIDDWKEIRKRFDAMQSTNKILMTTEKDAVRLLKFEPSMSGYPLYVIPMQVEFLHGCGARFSNFITTFITGFTIQKETINA